MNSPLTTTTSNPVSANERSAILDILRGFALLGILLANSAVFSFYVMKTPTEREALSTFDIDRILAWLHFAFVDGKFYSLFSLLFGIGFSIIFLRNKSRGNNGLVIFYRRLFVLALFGIAHSFLIWDGDILFFYALVGMFLPLFRNVKDRTLIVLAICLLASPLVIDLIKVLTNGKWDISSPFLKAALASDKKIGLTDDNIGTWLMVNRDYHHIRDWNYTGFRWNWFFRMESNRPVKVLAMFLLGLYAGRNFIYGRLEEYKPLIKKVQVFGLALGISAGIFHAWFEFDRIKLPAPGGLLDTLFYALNVVPLSLGYVATITLWYMNGKFHRILAPLQYVGRMALTNYIMQSILAIFIYYGIGLGLAASAGPAIYMPVAMGIFLFQIVYSRIWLRYFNYGPLEWIWRMLTYGKRLPILKRKA